jgi:uncharacterized membrane protein
MEELMDRRHTTLALCATLVICLVSGAAGCQFLGGAAVGAGATGAAYEYENKRALELVERDFAAGRISRDEYLERKRDIEKRSIVH